MLSGLSARDSQVGLTSDEHFTIKYLSSLYFSDPSDPISPKDNPTRVPYSPKNPDGKDTHNNNDVLEKSGKINYSQFKSGELSGGFGTTIVRPAQSR